MMRHKSSEYLRRDFTPTELASESQTLARVTQELAMLEEQKKKITSEISASIKAKQTEVLDASRRVSQGYEYTMVDCEWHFDQPELGLKQLVRMDTGEVVREAVMSDEEKQQWLALGEGEGARAN